MTRLGRGSKSKRISDSAKEAKVCPKRQATVRPKAACNDSASVYTSCVQKGFAYDHCQTSIHVRDVATNEAPSKALLYEQCLREGKCSGRHSRPAPLDMTPMSKQGRDKSKDTKNTGQACSAELECNAWMDTLFSAGVSRMIRKISHSA